MTSIRSATEVLQAFVVRGDGRMWSLWNALPDGLDRALVARAMQRAMHDGHSARAVGRRLNDSYFDLFVAELRKHPRWPETVVTLMVAPERQREELGELFRKLRLLINARGMATERIREFAKDPQFTQMLTAVVSGADLEPILRWRCLGVLLEVGSPETLDGALPFVEAALKDGGDELTELRARLHDIKRPTEAVKPLIETVERAVRRRPGHAALPKVMQALGLKPRKKAVKWQWYTLSSRPKSVTVVIKLVVDFETDPWFRAHVTEMRGEVLLRESLFTSRTSSDPGPTPLNQLQLEPLTAFLEFPLWVDRVKLQLGGAWEPGELQAQTTADDERVITQWLDGPPRSP